MENIKDLVEKNDLKHIAIIMDGNRRWAKERNLPSAVGHKKGVDALKATMRACDDFGVKYLTVYAFSTENWNRKPEEVNFLMDLLGQTLKNELQEMHENNVVISFIGDTTKLSDKLQEILTEEEKDIARRARNTKMNTVSKNAPLADYKKATSFEAIIGFNYLLGNLNRIKEWFDILSKDFLEGRK